MLRISPQSPIDETDYKERFATLHVLHSPEAAKIVTYWLGGFMILFFVVLFLPWQQNIRAEGELTALNPDDRPQTVETAIAGRIAHWHVREGQWVDSGQVLVEISEVKEKFFDPNLVLRLKEQVKAKEEAIQSKSQKADALSRQIDALKRGLQLKLEQTQQKIVQKRLKVESDSNDWEATKVDLQIAQRQMQGAQTMYESGLIPLIKLESAKSKIQQAQAKLVSAKNKWDTSKNDYLIEVLNINTLEMEALDKISKAESDRDNTLAELYESQGDLAKARNELANMSIRNEQYKIRAPQFGYVVKALKQGLGETVKEGEALLTIMPAFPDMAVALYVKPMDVPLLSVGRHVRLQFDGWPALQFTGWPSVSVGTFGGKVEVIDYVNSKGGKYRILITPDFKSEDDETWPEELRMGSGVYGWVMLDDVPIWFELWRQLNGFPPTLQSYQLNNADGEIKEKEEEEKKGK
jgi:multidrug resistance efflux pump